MAQESETKTDSSQDDSDENILAIARERFDLAVEAEANIRKEALDDLKFRAGDQWDDEQKKSREADGRPCLTINRLPQYVHQVANDQRQNRPSIKVSPVDDKADPETAKILQGMIRHIEYNSNADIAYDTAFEGTCNKGLGYFRIVTDYCDPYSFDQEIFIKRILDSFCVYLDPHYQQPDGSDANWGFIFEDMSFDDYKAQFGDSDLSKMEDWKSVGDSRPGWVNSSSKTVRIAEYFYKTFRTTQMVQLSNGMVVEKSKIIGDLGLDENGRPIEIINERNVVLPAIKWCKINGVEVLEKTDWPGLWIPIIPVLGDELFVDGKRILEGVIRHAKDPQRMYNYWNSAATETIALAPRAPFIGAEGQFEGFEAQWKMANRRNHSYLQYKPMVQSGDQFIQVGPPMRNVYEPPIQAINQAMFQSAEDLKATTGIYDASLGNKSNENSGIAIQRRNLQAQTNTFHFIDNLSRSIRHGGRIILDLIPKVYDTARAARILGEDGQSEVIRINEIFQKDGKQQKISPNIGKYDVTVETGPSYATKRQEAVVAMLEFTKALPQQAASVSDLIAKNMDWPGAEEFAERFRKMLPPGLADDKDGKKPLPPEVTQQLTQMNQMIETLTNHLNDANQKIENSMIELESKERIEMAKIKANIEIELAKMEMQDSQLLLKTEIAQLGRRLDLLGINQPIESENEPADGASTAPSPDQINQPTGGMSPGSPMGV